MATLTAMAVLWGGAVAQIATKDATATVKIFAGEGCTGTVTSNYTVSGFCNESVTTQSRWGGGGAQFMVAGCLSGTAAHAACGADSCVQIWQGKSRLDCVAERLENPTEARAIVAGQCVTERSRYGADTFAEYTCDGGDGVPTSAPTLNSLAKFDAGGEIAFFGDLGCEQPTAAPGGGKATMQVPPLTECAMPATGGTVYGMGCIDGPEAFSWCQDSQCVVLCQFNTTDPHATQDCQDTIGTDQKALVDQLENHDSCQILPATGCTPVYEPVDDDGYQSPNDYGTVEFSTYFTCPKKAPPYPPGNPTKPLPPMVMVPGLTNSLINMKLDHAAGAKLLGCNSSTDGQWAQLWQFPQTSNPKELLCYAYYMSLKLDNATQSFSAPLGITTELVDFGGIDGLPALSGAAESYEMAGWELGKNFAGAPYDWRLPVSQQRDGFIAKTKALVEKLYAANKATPVVLMGVSFGPQNALGFLHAMTQPWKDKFIGWFVALSPVWSGSTLMLQDYISGFSMGHSNPTMTEVYLTLLHATPFGGWTFPRKTSEPSVDGNYTWGKDDVVIATPSKNYTVLDYAELFKDLGYLKIQVETIDFCISDADLNEFASPGVNTFVAYGYGIPTAVGATYAADFKRGTVPPQPASTMGSGDSLVPLRSSKRGYVWADALKKQGKQLVIRGYEGQYHAGCMTTQPDEPNPCFMDWFSLITNGTIPASDPKDMVQEHTGFGRPFTVAAADATPVVSAVPYAPLW